MKKIGLLLIFLFISILSFSQNEINKIKCEKVYDAIKLTDEGKYDESIKILSDCEKVDSLDYTYPYEIALAYYYKKEYKKAIDKLEKIKNLKSIKADYYQLLGNSYDVDGNTEKAIQTYNEGLKKFPNAGRLYLEKGVVNEIQNNYSEAIKSYEKGISKDPMYSSNYYRLSKIYLNSNDKLSGLIYGEIFMNLETNSKRTIEMSELLFKTYQNSIKINGDSIDIDFCKIIIDSRNKEFNIDKLPLCAVFEKNFIIGIIGQKQVNLKTLSEIRIEFIKNYFKKDNEKYPNVLFEYQKELLDDGIFDAYNEYLFQMGAQSEFVDWKKQNEELYKKFVDWYSEPSNYLKIDDENVFISGNYK